MTAIGDGGSGHGLGHFAAADGRTGTRPVLDRHLLLHARQCGAIADEREGEMFKVNRSIKFAEVQMMLCLE